MCKTFDKFHVCEDDYDENVVDDENDGDGQMVVTIRIANIPMSLTHLSGNLQ